MARVGFVGLGVMGGPMAGHLLKAGHEVIVWNRSPGKADSLEQAGAHVAETLEDVAQNCSIIFLCVSRTEDVEQCLAQMTSEAEPNTLFVDHSTISVTGAKKIHQDLAKKGHRFLDAPITGGSMGAQKGQLTIFVGGRKADFDEALPFMQAYAKRAEWVGEAGAGQTTKMANQVAVAGALLGLCESLAFAEKAGLDVSLTRELLAGGAAGSWAFDNYGPKVLAGDWSPGFSIINQRKDFGYCVEAADALDLELPMTELCDRLLKILDDEGRGQETTAAVYEVLKRPRSGEAG